MGQLLIGYTVFMLTLFALGSALIGLKTTVLGFGFFYVVCTFIVFTIWWWHEYQWSSEAPAPPMPAGYALPSLAPIVSLHPASRNTEEDPLLALAAACEERNLSSLESRIEAITNRVSTVYPLVAREDIHKIVWMALIEMCYDQTQITDQTSSKKTSGLRSAYFITRLARGRG